MGFGNWSIRNCGSKLGLISVILTTNAGRLLVVSHFALPSDCQLASSELEPCLHAAAENALTNKHSACIAVEEIAYHQRYLLMVETMNFPSFPQEVKPEPGTRH